MTSHRQTVTTERAVSRRVLLTGGLAAGLVVLTDASGVIVGAEAQAPAGGAGPQPPTPLAQAVRVAEQRTGGRSRKAEMDRERGVDVYEIKTVSKDGSAKVHVDPATGNILRVKGPGFVTSIVGVFDSDDRKKDQAALARLEASPMTLVGAIDAAERDTRGRAVKAAVKSQFGATLFEISVVKDRMLHSVVVDPANGKVVAVPSKHKGDDD